MWITKNMKIILIQYLPHHLILMLKSIVMKIVYLYDVYHESVKGYVDITNSMNDFIKSQGLHYEGCIGMEMTKRFNSAR